MKTVLSFPLTAMFQKLFLLCILTLILDITMYDKVVFTYNCIYQVTRLQFYIFSTIMWFE